MSAIIEQLSKIFSHLARETQIYFLSGLTLFIELLYLFERHNDFISKCNSFWIYLGTAIFLYLIGHITLSIYNLFDLFPLCKKNDKATFRELFREINVFNVNPKLNVEFIERYNLLYLMRYNIACTLLLVAIISGITWIFKDFKNNTDLIFLIANAIFGILMWYLAHVTKKEFKIRLRVINTYLNKDN